MPLTFDTADARYSISLSGFAGEPDYWAWTFSEHDPSSPIERVIRDMERSIKARLYYPALLVALTLPEICAGLSLPKEKIVRGKNYKQFIKKYTTEQSLGVDEISCYSLRSGLVHRADLTKNPIFDHTHVIFTIPESRRRMFPLTLVHKEQSAIVLDLVKFCETMKIAARNWYKDNQTDPEVQKNMKDVIRLCPYGIRPFFDGIPVVASGP